MKNLVAQMIKWSNSQKVEQNDKKVANNKSADEDKENQFKTKSFVRRDQKNPEEEVHNNNSRKFTKTEGHRFPDCKGLLSAQPTEKINPHKGTSS